MRESNLEVIVRQDTDQLLEIVWIEIDPEKLKFMGTKSQVILIIILIVIMIVKSLVIVKSSAPVPCEPFSKNSS